MLDHEKLNVYQAALKFLDWLNPIFDKTPKGLAVRDQLDRSSTSIPLNIAEGNGKFGSRDRGRFLQIACGSALECAACLDVLTVKRVIDTNLAAAGKAQVEGIVSMLMGLMNSISSRGVREESETYLVVGEGGDE